MPVPAYKGKPVISEAVDHRVRLEAPAASSSDKPLRPRRKYDLYCRQELGESLTASDGKCGKCGKKCGHDVTFTWFPEEDVPKAVREQYWMIYKDVARALWGGDDVDAEGDDVAVIAAPAPAPAPAPKKVAAPAAEVS